MASNETDELYKQLQKGGELTEEEAKKVSDSFFKNKNFGDAVQLLGAYFLRKYNDEKINRERNEIIFWVIENLSLIHI